ncbi:MAG: response regulator transcription factor [Novosphingobium sp.]|nr:response regulator transcription factor [Novosphingobium sp.]
MPAPLLIVEDDQVMQDRLRLILMALGYSGSELVIAGNLAQARALYPEQPFALALIDIHLPDGTGIDLIRDWHEYDPALPLLVVSAWSTGALIVEAIQAGATGYLLKQRDDAEIAMSIRSALRGGAPIDPFVARHILAIAVPDPPAAAAAAMPPQGRLSPREIDILILVSQGLTNKEIAGTLSLSRLTVECYTKAIYKKLAVRSRTQAVFAARARGLLP